MMPPRKRTLKVDPHAVRRTPVELVPHVYVVVATTPGGPKVGTRETVWERRPKVVTA
jgi:hypothetical protein